MRIGRIRGRLALILFLAMAFGVARAPAGLVDRAVQTATEGRLRALGARGTLWAGEASFASASPDGRSVRPWLRARWTTEFGELLRGGIAWRLTEADLPILRLRLGMDGVGITGARFDAPAGALIGSVPHAYARAGWRGALRLSADEWHCAWDGECRGRARVEWIGAGLDLLPGQRLGDYALDVAGFGKSGTLVANTLRGDFSVSGQGGWEAGSRPYFNGEVRGRAEIVSRLPNVMDGHAHATADPTAARIELR